MLAGLVCLRPAFALNWASDITLSPAEMSYSGPADSVTGGSIIGGNWSATATVTQVFWCGWVYWCSKSTMEPDSSIVLSGQTVVVDGVSYAVFETGVPGIGFILGLKDTNATTYVPLQTGITQTFPAEGTAESNELGWSAKVTFVKTGQPLASGTYITPTITAAILTAYNNEVATAKVIISPTSINVNATGCTINTPSVPVDMGSLDVRSFNTVNSTSALKNFSVNLNCDANIALYAVVTDQTDPTNTSDTVSLTPDSTATGVGVQFFYNNTGPLALGPDSSLNSTVGQFFIQSTSQAETLTLPFQSRYIRTGDITPGTADAVASITFSYQ
ncbi:fimbrial protein [Pantoea sp. BAV 3049]|uniref:fimbrial protein n=1 Tax=Pantoea sp. BAV 3049 TaxID=2654188 RepID=UPI00131B2733|nr:fimbrial protein [Pantoea sp. BAV 3049]